MLRTPRQSSRSFASDDPPGTFWMMTDRGPNPLLRTRKGVRRAFPTPGFTPHILKVRAADRALKWIRRTYPYLPELLRYAGPYREAQARLLGRPRLDLATRCLNRAWIGRPRLE